MVFLSPHGCQHLRKRLTTVTDASLWIDNSVNAFAKIGTALTLSSAALFINNKTSNANTTVAGTTIGAGQSQIEVENGTGLVTLGTISNSNYGTVNLFTASVTTPGGIAASGTTGNLVGGWATLGTDFAAIGTGTVAGTIGVATYTTLTASGLNNAANNANYANSANLTMTGNTTANSLRINDNGNVGTLDQTIALGSNSVLLASGGLLVATSNGISTNITGTGTIYGDTGASDNTPVYVTVDPASAAGGVAESILTISAPVVSDAGHGSGVLVKAGYGELIVTAPAVYTGGTVINGGVLRRRRKRAVQWPVGAQ